MFNLKDKAIDAYGRFVDDEQVVEREQREGKIALTIERTRQALEEFGVIHREIKGDHWEITECNAIDYHEDFERGCIVVDGVRLVGAIDSTRRAYLQVMGKCPDCHEEYRSDGWAFSWADLGQILTHWTPVEHACRKAPAEEPTAPLFADQDVADQLITLQQLSRAELGQGYLASEQGRLVIANSLYVLAELALMRANHDEIV